MDNARARSALSIHRRPFPFPRENARSSLPKRENLLSRTAACLLVNADF